MKYWAVTYLAHNNERPNYIAQSATTFVGTKTPLAAKAWSKQSGFCGFWRIKWKQA